jgi:hypothetical protein
MKLFNFFVYLVLCTSTASKIMATIPHDLLFSLKASSTWREFTAAPTTKKVKSPDKRVLIGEITLKSKDSVFLDELVARWRGGNVGNLVASLYTKKITDHKSPVPIDDNLICDGTWNPQTREFVFPVKKKLVASDTYYLMLHMPAKFEKQLRTGSFEIIQHEKRALLNIRK